MIIKEHSFMGKEDQTNYFSQRGDIVMWVFVCLVLIILLTGGFSHVLAGLIYFYMVPGKLYKFEVH